MTRETALTIGARADRSLVSESATDLAWLRLSIPCQDACPAGTDVPAYLEAIYHGRLVQAYAINLRDNVFPAVLGRVCSRPCEAACRHGADGNGEPVAICFSKRSAADFSDGSPVILEPLFPPSGKTVAIVGSGPAGLVAARELARFGHRVTVFERHRKPGGMMNQGIPVFRLPRSVLEREIGQITAMGVVIRCGIAVDEGLPLGGLAREYDAVVIAAGTQRPNMLGVPGQDLKGVEHGLPFLLEVNEFGRRSVGAKSVVVGGGYTAMDCARVALRLGAQSRVHYRRTRADMVVLPGELDELCVEGGIVSERCTPVEFLGDRGRVRALRLVLTRAGAPGPDGRPLAVPIRGSDFEIEVDGVILATGQFPDTSWIDPPLRPALVRDARRLASGTGVSTAIANIFVAGDFALGASTVIQAIGHAKRCALEVDAFLTGERRIKDVAEIGPVFQSKTPGGRTTGRKIEMNRIPIHPMPTLPWSDRTLSAEVDLGYSGSTAAEAASRCYLCHYKFEILDERCVLCDECIRVKPVPGCIVEISGTHRAEGAVVRYEPVIEGVSAPLYYSRLWIDQAKCIRCGACEAACPVNAITIQKVSLVPQTCTSGGEPRTRATEAA